jgi:hypothetical protein
VALASISCIFRVFIEGAAMFIEGAIEGAVEGAVEEAVEGVIKGAVTFIGEGGSAIGRLFKVAGARVVNNIKGVNRRNLRQWLIAYKLKGPLLLINSLISASNYSIQLSL